MKEMADRIRRAERAVLGMMLAHDMPIVDVILPVDFTSPDYATIAEGIRAAALAGATATSQRIARVAQVLADDGHNAEARQLDGLAAGAGLFCDPERFARRVAEWSEWRCRFHAERAAAIAEALEHHEPIGSSTARAVGEYMRSKPKRVNGPSEDVRR